MKCLISSVAVSRAGQVAPMSAHLQTTESEGWCHVFVAKLQEVLSMLRQTVQRFFESMETFEMIKWVITATVSEGSFGLTPEPVGGGAEWEKVASCVFKDHIADYFSSSHVVDEFGQEEDSLHFCSWPISRTQDGTKKWTDTPECPHWYSTGVTGAHSAGVLYE